MCADMYACKAGARVPRKHFDGTKLYITSLIMASRNLTRQYEAQRANKPSKNSDVPVDIDTQDFSHLVDPTFARTEEVLADLRRQILLLGQLRERACRVSFDGAQQVQELQAVHTYSSGVGSVIRQVLQNIEHLEKNSREKSRSSAESLVVTNRCRHYKQQLQVLVGKFRQDYAEYNTYVQRFANSQAEEDASTPFFQTQTQTQMSARAAQQRQEHAAVVQIARDVEQLSELFRDLGLMLAHQSELVDRIENHMNTADRHMQVAVQDNLIPAEKSSRPRCACACLFFLIVLNVVLVALCAVKWNNK
jgi:hypothetical protein